MIDGQAILLAAAWTAIGIILGAVASWYIARWYYLKASKDFNVALNPLKIATNALVLVQESPSNTKVTRDAEGNTTGVSRSAACHIQAASALTAVGSSTFTPSLQAPIVNAS